MKLRLPPLPRRIDKERLFRIYSPKLYFEQKSARSEKRLKETLENPAANKYVRASVQICADGDRKDLQEFLESEDAEYKRRFKVTIAEDEKKAMDGHNRSLFRLIAWDKRWLWKDWVKRKILIADIDDNRTFFEQLADAIKSRKYKQRAQKQYTVEFVGYLQKIAASGIYFGSYKDVKMIYEWLTSFDSDRTDSDRIDSDRKWDLCEIPALNSLNDFNKFLKRHNLR